MMRRLRLVLPFLAAWLLAGCFAVESEIVVNEDGSGTQTLRMTLPSELLALAGGEVPTAEDLNAEMQADPANAAMVEALEANGGSFSFFSDEESLGFEMVINVPASDDFGAALEEIAASIPSQDEIPLETIQNETSLKKVGDEWQFSSVAPAMSSDDLASMAGDPSMAGMMEGMMGEVTIVSRLKLPGDVKDHNADEVLADGTLVWNIDPLSAGDTEMHATSDVGGGLGTPAIAGIVIGALVVVGLAAFLVMRARKPSAEMAPPVV